MISGMVSGAMRYELYLRAPDPTPKEAGRILRDLQEDPQVQAVAGSGWEHTSDEGIVAVARYPRQDPRWAGRSTGVATPLGLDLSVAGGAGEALASRLAELTFDWAGRWSLQVYDPQLGRTVEKDDLETVTARIKQHADYLTETVGLGESSTRFMDVDVPAVRLSLRTRFYLGLAAALLLLGLAAHYCR
jgi:hypothetical protein